MRNNSYSIFGGVLASLLLTATAQAATSIISVNFKQFAGAVNDPNEPYGVESASNWTNLDETVSSTNLVMDGGAASTVDLSGTAPGGYGTNSGGGVLDNTVLRAGMRFFANPGTLILSQLSSTFISYDVIVYITGLNGGAAEHQGSFSDGTTTYYATIPSTYTTSLIQSTDTNSGDGVDTGTYVRFNGLTADSVTITASTVLTNTGIGGFQIVGTSVPEPATALLLVPLGLMGLFARNRKRVG